MADRPTAPVFQTLDDCPTHRRMVVDSRRPAVRLATDEPIDGYSWELFQHGVVVESARNVTDGITDGRCIQFRPTVALRRGRPEDAPLPDGFFYPPFRPGRTYRTETYHGHSDFSVDFNRGNAGVDDGDWVRAPAPGTVSLVNFRAPGTLSSSDPGESDLLIEHSGGFRTLFTHMKRIPPGFRVGTPIRLGQRLGRISAVGNAAGSHLHHAHFRAEPGAAGFGRPIRMRIQDVPMEASVGDSNSRPSDWPGVFGQTVRLPVLKPRLRVRARRVSDSKWSPWRELRFLVSESGDEVPDCVDPGCGPAIEG